MTTEEHAAKIARDRNVPAGGAGFATRSQVRRDYLDACGVQEAGGGAHREYRIPAEDTDAFDAAIVGPIEVVARFGNA